MNKINRQYILYALCALSLLALFFPMFNVDGGNEYYQANIGTVNIFYIMGVSIFGYVLMVAPLFLAGLDRIKQLEKYNNILSIAVPVVCLLCLGLVYLNVVSSFDYGIDSEWYENEVTIDIGTIIAGVSYIGCAALGVIKYFGVKTTSENSVNSIMGKFDVSQIKSAVEDGGEVLKLKTAILNEEKNAENIMKEIGKKYLLIHGDSNEADFKELIISAKEVDQKIKNYKKQIQIIKGIKICPQCGEELAANSAFCNNCGAVIPKDSDDLVKCHNCGKMIPKEKKFCAYCGAKVEVVEEKPIEEKIVCPNCGSHIEAGVMFCCECGAKIDSTTVGAATEPVIKKCPGCGAKVDDDLVFCMECGTRLKE